MAMTIGKFLQRFGSDKVFEKFLELCLENDSTEAIDVGMLEESMISVLCQGQAENAFAFARIVAVWARSLADGWATSVVRTVDAGH